MMLVTPHELRELKRIQKDVGSELELASVPQKNSNLEERVKTLFTMVKSERPKKSSEVILEALVEKSNISTVVAVRKLGKSLAGRC